MTSFAPLLACGVTPRRGMLLGAAALVLTTALPTAWSQTPAVVPTPNERLMALVPERVGEWVRFALRGARPGPDGQTLPAAQAEFHRQDVRAWLSVGQSTRPAPPPPATPSERITGAGSEKSYAVGDATVLESVRRVDGRVDVTLLRADGVVVSVWGVGMAAAELKGLALAVRPLPPR